MYKIDPFNGKAIIDFDVFINAFGGFLTYYIVGSDSEQFTLEDNWDKQAKVDEMEKGAKDKNKYTPTAKVAPVQETLRLLGCGRKGTTYGLIKDLAVTGYYNADTVDAVREFQYKFMEIDIFKTDGEIIGDGLKNGKPDPNELNTAGELSKYNKVRLIANNRGGGKSWIKDSGVRVREYLTICYSPAFNGIFDFAMVGGVPKIYYRESQYAPKVQLLIDGLHYEPTEFKCYAKIISIEKAINAYNQQKNQIGKHISSVKILPGVINSSGKPVMGQTYELKTPKNYYFKDILMPYEDMRVVCGLFSGSYGTGQMVADTVCVASFKNFNSDTVILYFDTVNKTIKDGSGNIVREIDFRPFQDNYVKNAIMVNILQLAVYLGFYDFYTVKQANQDYQLCIETVRVPKGSISISNIASLTVSSLPISGEYKDLQEAITGIDLITQEELSTTDRIITVACVLFPIISGKL
jgi:peptidoglycan hydrolase-like protein with peptidoglycan-binding domain